MRDEVFERYQKEREEVLQKYRKKKGRLLLIALCVGLPLGALLLWMGSLALIHIPFVAVGALILLIFGILYLRIRLVRINHAMQKELLKLEDRYSLHSNL